MPHFHDEGIYDRSWDQLEGEDCDCDCYWLAGGDENADVECGHCARRRKARETHQRRFAENPWYKQCDVIKVHIDQIATLKTAAERADKLAELFRFLMKKAQREFLVVIPSLREAIRNKALENITISRCADICAKMLHYIDRQLPFAFGYQLSERESAEFADHVYAEAAELELCG